MTKKIFINSKKKYDGLSFLTQDIKIRKIFDIKTLIEKLRKFVSQKQWVPKGPLYDSPRSYAECKVLVLLGHIPKGLHESEVFINFVNQLLKENWIFYIVNDGSSETFNVKDFAPICLSTGGMYFSFRGKSKKKIKTLVEEMFKTSDKIHRGKGHVVDKLKIFLESQPADKWIPFNKIWEWKSEIVVHNVSCNDGQLGQPNQQSEENSSSQESGVEMSLDEASASSAPNSEAHSQETSARPSSQLVALRNSALISSISGHVQRIPERIPSESSEALLENPSENLCIQRLCYSLRSLAINTGEPVISPASTHETEPVLFGMRLRWPSESIDSSLRTPSESIDCTSRRQATESIDSGYSSQISRESLDLSFRRLPLSSEPREHSMPVETTDYTLDISLNLAEVFIN
ncbi:uncharacterized protein LOC130612365 [Hydractinia symbiolongicarpus]|uniref:uncharacterized protein LOC130612365 n=1 Tax=Hydractinia symbiolongicarpus TaxID=13093 RepID=UPI00255105FB|nr:uncharacterized protein LOC130612365 [Hydractinia symbiolongicarpus]